MCAYHSLSCSHIIFERALRLQKSLAVGGHILADSFHRNQQAFNSYIYKSQYYKQLFIPLQIDQGPNSLLLRPRSHVILFL